MTIAAALDAVRSRADASAREAGRDPSEVSVLLATKTQPAPVILEALNHGFTLIGENRVQELQAKADELAAVPHEAHLIGPLQKNKVNHALRHATCIQSIDDAATAEKIQRRLEAEDATVEIFVQVNTSREETKFGVAPEGASALLAQLTALDRLRIRGLMTIGLPGSTAEEIRPSYADLRELSARLRQDGALPESATELSMGMSQDFELAIAEGATMVRVGSSVFGARPAPQ